MNKIGSWWLASFVTEENENVLWSCLANRTQSNKRAVGGKLFLTNKRLLFCPHLFDYVLGGQKLSINLNEIASIDNQDKGGDFFGGGARKRLKISLKDGNIELFVVNKLDMVVEELKQHISKILS